jgi:hypothetical protein
MERPSAVEGITLRPARPFAPKLERRKMETRMTERYLEDLAVGQIFGSGRLSVDADQIKAFAAEFDPQPFHLDEKAANDTFFRGLAASGWHTAALTMRLLVEGDLKVAGGVVGAGAKSLGRGRRAPATSSASKAKCSKCVRRNRARSRDWSKCARRRSTRMANLFRFWWRTSWSPAEPRANSIWEEPEKPSSGPSGHLLP